MAPAAAVLETRGTASRAVLDSPDLMARCLEFVPDYFPEFAAVSRTFRATAAEKLQRALTFVRGNAENGPGSIAEIALGSIMVSESARAAFDEDDVYEGGLGGEHAFENWIVKREFPKDALALFRFAWIVAPGETITAVGDWNEIARLRWCMLVEVYKDFRKDRRGRCDHDRLVVSFEHAYRFMAARSDAYDLLMFGKRLVEMYDDYMYKSAVYDDEGISTPVLRLWSDSRLVVSFIYGPTVDAAQYCDIETKADCDETADDFSDSCRTYTFRQAYNEMMSPLKMKDEDDWDPEYACEYACRVAVAELHATCRRLRLWHP